MAKRKPKAGKPRKRSKHSKHSKHDLARMRAARRKAAASVELRALIREAAKVGAAEAIEHCANFWSVSDGYKKYIDYQIESQAEALMATVRRVVAQLILVQNSRRKR